MPTPVSAPVSRSLRALVVLMGLGWSGVGWGATECDCYCDLDGDGCESNSKLEADILDEFCEDTCKIYGCKTDQGTDTNDTTPAVGGQTTYYPDCDGDGDGDASAAKSACTSATLTGSCNWIDEGGDCNDSDASINQSRSEIVGNSIDEDCDNYCDCYVDLDNDEVGGLDASSNPITTQSSPYKASRPGANSGSCDVLCDKDWSDGTTIVYLSIITNDCDDGNANRFPGNSEKCEDPSLSLPVDNDCDEYYNYDGYPENVSKDEANPDNDDYAQPFSYDKDGDGYGDEENVRQLCVAGGTDYARPQDAPYTSSRIGDCNDDDKFINPGALDYCNENESVDDDCDGMRDNPRLEDDLREELSRIATDGTIGWSNKSLEVDSVEDVTIQDVRSVIGCTYASIDDDADGQGDASMPQLCICDQNQSTDTETCGLGPTGEPREWRSEWMLCTSFAEEEFCEQQSDDASSEPSYTTACVDALSDLQLTYFVEEGGDVPFSGNTNDCDDTDAEIFLQLGVLEILDGKDSDCSGSIPASEFDCDGDGYIIGSVDESDVEAGVDVFETDAGCLRGRTEAITCQTTARSGVPVEVTIECEQRSIIDVDGSGRYNLSQWVVDLGEPAYSPMLILGTKRNHTFLGGGDCDDTWGDRSPGATEICDGIDTDCSSAVSCSTLDALFDQCNSMICDDEADPDCDGYITCTVNELVDQKECFEILDPDGMCVGDEGSSEAYSIEGGGDTWGYCARSVPLLAPEEELSCDGILPPKRAHAHAAERDEDGDAHLACGPSWPESPADVGEESVFMLAYFVVDYGDEDEAGVDTGSSNSKDSNTTDVDTSYAIPLLLPRAIEGGDDEQAERRVVPSDWALQGKLMEELSPFVAAIGFDESLALAPVVNGRTFEETSDEAYINFDPLLDLCVRAEVCHTLRELGDEALLDKTPWCASPPRGRCAVVELELNADGFRKGLSDAPYPSEVSPESGAPDSHDSTPSTNEPILSVAGELGVRQVWSAERILESRRRVVEWDCFVTLGTYGCGGLDTTPVRGAIDQSLNDGLDRFVPAIDGGARGRDFVSEKLLFMLETDDTWWQEIGRFRSSATSEEAEVLSRYDDNLLSCWGDPTVDPDLGNSISPRVGGDCADGADGAHRDGLEGPYDLRSGFIDKIASCETCLDGLDNNCDGLMDCEDPGCAPCFIGQGTGCAGAAEGSPCASSGGCSAGRGARAPGLAALITLLLGALTLPLRRRSTQ